MAKILMINPIVREEDVPKHIPYGIALLASIAVNRGHQVQIFDANAWRAGDDVLRQAITADDWDAIGIGGLITTYNHVKRICNIAKQEMPNALLIVGGGLLTSMPREIMNWIPQIDLGVVGEAFVTFPEILDKIDRDELDFSSTLGVCYRDKDRVPHLTNVRANIANLDCLPYPAWDFLPMDIYFRNSRGLFSEEIFTSKRRIDVNGSLGCSLVCRYCWHLGTTGDMVIEPDSTGENDVRFSYGRNIRYHSPEYIVGMVKTLVDKYQIDFASFLDENMMTMHVFSKKKWLFELSDLWIKAGLQPTCRRDGIPHDENCRGVHWAGTSHAGLADRESLAAMFKAGCSHLVYGIESFAPKILKKLGKGSTAQTNRRAIKTCLEVGIKPIPNVIIGFPEEDFDTIRETMDGMIEVGMYAKPHFATPYPGSQWYYNYKKSITEQYGGNLEEFVKELGDASSITAIISHKFSAMDLIGLQEIVYRRDRRLLDQAEKHWGKSDSTICSVAVCEDSFNFISKKVQAPMESESRKSL